VYTLWALSEAALTLLAWFGQGPGTHRAAPPLFAPHAAAGGIALAAGALQLCLLRRTPKGSRPRHPRLHRTLGRVYIYTAWITGVAGLAVAARFNVGPTAKAAFALEGGLWLLATTLGYVSARRRNLRVHRAWMIRSYALALFIVTFSLLQPLVTGAGLSRTATYTLLVLISVGANLAGAEALVRRLNRRTAA
jgi:uncharacterized membrane protein